MDAQEHGNTSLSTDSPIKPSLSNLDRSLEKPIGSQSSTPQPRKVIQAKYNVDTNVPKGITHPGITDNNACSIAHYVVTLTHGRCLRQVITKVGACPCR